MEESFQISDNSKTKIKFMKKQGANNLEIFHLIQGISAIENQNNLFVKNEFESFENTSTFNSEDTFLDRSFLQESILITGTDSHFIFLKPFSAVKNEDEQSSFMNKSSNYVSFIQ